ncbi:MAG: ABC transporter ATP-binding protein [Bacilli bacterium]
MKYIIETNDLSKKIKIENILDNINIRLEEGNIYGFVGRNGSGKSMLFKTICGFVKPTEGEILVNGVDIYKKNTFPDDTRALIEKPKFLPHLTGFENLELLASIQNKIGTKKIIESLEKVGLLAYKDKKFGAYSLGMKQKLGIAQVLMEDPKILLLDEPFNGLDEQSAKNIRKILLIEKEKGKLILIATHIKEDVEILCDEVFYLDVGKIINHKIINKN